MTDFKNDPRLAFCDERFRCDTCSRGITFYENLLPDSLRQDVVFCFKFYELMDDVDKRDPDERDCWECF